MRTALHMAAIVGMAVSAAAAGAAPADSLAERADAARSAGRPGVTVTAGDRDIRFDVRPEAGDWSARLFFRQPLKTAGKDRLLLEGRSEEFTHEGLCVSRVTLLDATGREAATCKQDLVFPPEWNERTLLLSDFTGKVPAEVSGVLMILWHPFGAGRQYSLLFRRFDFASSADVAAAMRAEAAEAPKAPAAPAKAQPQSPLDAPPADRRWTSFGPGGGGWFRVVAFSPHNGACFVGADVGGIYRSADNCRSWEMLNTGVPDLYVNTFAFHPTNARIVYAGCYGGVVKSTDGGTTWQVKRSGFPPVLTSGQSAPISALTTDPTQPDVVYAGTGHEREYGRLDGAISCGFVYKSTDAGETWQRHELPGGDAVHKLSVFCIRIDPRDNKKLYATTQGGLFQSADGGETWQRFGAGLDGYATCFLVIQPEAPYAMLMTYHNSPARSGGVLKSTDDGATWSPVNVGLPSEPDCWRIVAHPKDKYTFYVGWNRRTGLFVTHDAGLTWTVLNKGNMHSAWFGTDDAVTGLDVDPANPDRMVYCNSMEFYQTLNAGKTWDQVATDLARPADENHPAVWRGRGCEVLCVGGPQALAVNPADPRVLYFGFWDTCAWKSEDGGRTCFQLTDGVHSGFGRMGCVVLDPANPEIVYLSIGDNRTNQRVFKSVNGGRRFHLVGFPATGLPPGAVFCMAIDPSSPMENRILYAAVTGYGIYRSDDGGLTWSDRSNGLPAEVRQPLQIVLDPANPRRLFVASSSSSGHAGGKRMAGYIARSEDGGEHWKVVKTDINPQCVILDPFDPRKVYAGNRNFDGVDFPNAFYRSLDGGDTWESVGQDDFLAGPGPSHGDQGERTYVANLVADPATPGVLYAGLGTHEDCDEDNGRGVFRSTDWGRTWKPMPPDGLANFRIYTLVMDPTNPARLYVGTSGNSCFRWGTAP